MSESIKGKYICFTGKVEGFTRTDLQEMAKEYGFTFMERVNAATDILVKGERPGATKVSAAEKNNIKIMSAEDFIFMLGADEALGLKEPPTVETEEMKAERSLFYLEDQEAGMF